MTCFTSITEKCSRISKTSNIDIVFVWFWGDTMKENIVIYFKCEGPIYSLIMKPSRKKITLSMLEDMIYTKLGLGESNVKLQMKNYICRIAFR